MSELNSECGGWGGGVGEGKGGWVKGRGADLQKGLLLRQKNGINILCLFLSLNTTSVHGATTVKSFISSSIQRPGIMILKRLQSIN